MSGYRQGEARDDSHFNARPQFTPLQLLSRAADRSEVDAGECWIFRGALSQGYGTIGHKGVTWRVHRLAYVAMVGEIPDGLTLDHLCRNRACWNPAHLEPVPRGVNVLRGNAPTVVAYREGRCLRGHDMTDPRNVYTWPDHRQCAICARENARRRWAS